MPGLILSLAWLGISIAAVFILILIAVKPKGNVNRGNVNTMIVLGSGAPCVCFMDHYMAAVCPHDADQ